jgi:tRNA A37 threonylcarbamoyladenosine synthetase subunit TsaC/SUA5/YrdC
MICHCTPVICVSCQLRGCVSIAPALQDLAGRVAAVVDGGACACGVESTVLDGLRDPPVVLRPGGVTPELLAICPDMEGLQVST